MSGIQKITPELLLNAYAQGFFPMADGRKAQELGWFYPEWRGVLPLDDFHISRSLRKSLRSSPYRVTVSTACDQVIAACATAPRGPDNGCWISERIEGLYAELWQMGHVHSVECWDADDQLVGGLYGVSIGGVFCGESMFSTATNASKIALVYLVAILRKAGYQLLDTQYVNEHLLQFGIAEISADDYAEALANALIISPNPSQRFSAVSGSILAMSPDVLIDTVCG